MFWATVVLNLLGAGISAYAAMSGAPNVVFWLAVFILNMVLFCWTVASEVVK